MASSGFSFNFLAEGSAQDHVKEGDGDNKESVEVEASAPRLPFTWLDDDFGPLIVERSQEELVYTDVALDEDGALVSVISAADESSIISEAPPPLRCVDLTLSSYRRPLTADEEEVWNTKNTDIQPGLYEGGRKVWECSRDLVQYMVQEKITIHRLLMQQQQQQQYGTATTASRGDAIVEISRGRQPPQFFALEIGCGHGLPGCYLLREALKEKQTTSDFMVVFTDYNDSVVLDATISNIVLNCGIGESARTGEESTLTTTTTTQVEDVAPRVLLGAGDWMDMSKQLLLHKESSSSSASSSPDSGIKLPSDGKFDLILASETIYSEAAARETALLLKRHLQPETGVAYVATKRYYFGVGGGVDSFCAFCAQSSVGDDDDDDHDCRLQIETVKVVDNGTGNIREVLRARSFRVL